MGLYNCFDDATRMRARASSCETSLRFGSAAAAADFGKLLVGHAQVFPVRKIIEHGDGGGILLAIRQLLDLLDRIAQKFCHVSTIT